MTVKALIEKDDSFLFLKDHKGVWELPGGKIRFGESPKAALQRELREELGCEQAQIGSVVDVWTFDASEEGNDYQFIVLVFKCSIGGIEIKKSDEHVEYRWIPGNRVADFEMRDDYRRLVIGVR
ncbi:MAG: NUDIX domain-containing protein [Candidatus Colwellbacteria bacterium]|nr:NUDIX domain-containing protein [Candidatus Colwellbacteria bacterium]